MPTGFDLPEMIVHDVLYGRFSVPRYLSALILTPEVRRLSQIRLLNSLTPSVSALGEVRRYSHTLGVIHLAQQVSLHEFSGEENRALVAAVLAHDIGTPPFGHVMEYHLSERMNWSHEGVIRDILLGTHVPENLAHQIFGGRVIEFASQLRRSGISLELVLEIVQKRHPLSLLLFGTLDLDNLDNVVRMATFIGKRGCESLSIGIARALSVTKNNKLVLPESLLPEVRQWANLRREVYDVLLFDSYSIASQAVLWNAIRLAFEEGLIEAHDCFLTDEELLEVLRHHPKTKDAITIEYLGKPPNMALCLQFEGSLSELGYKNRHELIRVVEDVLRDVFSTDRVLGYVQVDSGTFEKELEFVTPAGKPWRTGRRSKSIIVYGFTRQHTSEQLCRKAVREFVERIAVPRDRLVRNQVELIHQNDQPALNFSSAQS
jgi:HD superfamily phosphohydrolase